MIAFNRSVRLLTVNLHLDKETSFSDFILHVLFLDRDFNLDLK